jgi:hypothetical protein
MFKIVPVRSAKKTRRKARPLLNGDPNPCPSGCTCSGSVNFGGVEYWVCITPEGTTIYVRQP